MEAQARTDPFPDRWDPRWIERRTAREAAKLGYCGNEEPGRPHVLPFHYRALKRLLRLAGLYDRGFRNYLEISLREEHHYLASWPAKLAGYRILQVSDPHIDLDPAFLPRLCQRVQGVEAELVVFTGDFWEGTHTSFSQSLAGMERILEAIPPPPDGCYGILGNHDACALGAGLEARGIPILVNEARIVGKGPAAFALAGVDDPFYFKLHDIGAAAAQCPAGLPSILLCHSPQHIRQAEQAGFNFMLCGHTHGGQICWPNGWPLVSIDGIPGDVFRGRWQYGRMKGYTSHGAGACHVPVRFNCPAEVVRHHFHAAR